MSYKPKVLAVSDGGTGVSSIVATSASTARTLAQYFSDQYSVKDWGAVGDGSTDDTAAIQAALDALNSAYPNGAKLIFPRGTYIASQIVIYRNQIIKSGDGVQACILKQKASSDKDFLISENFATLTGTGARYGTNANVPSWFGIEDIHIDGNASNQGAGNWRGIAWYGNAQLMIGNNLVQNCKGDNIYTEASGQFPYDAVDWKAEVEGFFDHVISQGSGGKGWLFRGPYDSIIIDYIGHENASSSFRNEISTDIVSGAPAYLGNCHIHSIHTYDETDHTGQYYAAQTTILECETDFDNITLDAAEIKINKLTQIGAGYGGLNALEITSNAVFCTIALHSIDFYTSATNVIGVNVQSSGGSLTIDNSQTTFVPGTSGITLYKIRSNFVTINAICSNASGSGSMGWDISAEYCKFTGQMSNCTTFITYAGDHNIVEMQIYTGGSGTILSGTPDATDTWNLMVDTGFYIQENGLLIQSAGYTSTGYKYYNLAGCMSGWNASGQIQSTFLGAEANSAFDYQTPSTGFNLTIDGSKSYMLLNPSGTLATGTINTVAFPVNGHKIYISTTQTIVSFTVTPQAGQTVKNAQSMLPAGSTLGWMYRSTDSTWYPILTTLTGEISKTSVITSGTTYTTAASDYAVIVNKASGSATNVNLITSPATGRTYIIKDGKGDAATNNITLTSIAGSIDSSSTYTINTNYASAMVIWNGSNWSLI